MFISKMKLLSNETDMGYETDDNYLLLCCKHFEISVVAVVKMYTTILRAKHKCMSVQLQGTVRFIYTTTSLRPYIAIGNRTTVAIFPLTWFCASI